jgi:hypothetical protein
MLHARPNKNRGVATVESPSNLVVVGRKLGRIYAATGRRPRRKKKAVDFSTAFFPSAAGQLDLAVSAQPKLAQPLKERSERLARVPVDSTVSVTGARPEDPIARAPAGVRSMTRPRM